MVVHYNSKVIVQTGWSSGGILLYFFMRELKVVSDSPGLVDFAFGLVNSVFNLPEGQINFFWRGVREFILEENCNQSCSSKIFSV